MGTALLVALALAACAGGRGVESVELPSPETGNDSTINVGDAPGDDPLVEDTAGDVALTPDDEPVTTTPVAPPRCAARAGGNDDVQEVVVWHAFSFVAAEVFEGLLRELDEREPGIVVRVEGSPGYDDVVARLRTSEPEDLPDVIVVPSSYVRAFADAEVTVDPAECAGGALPDELGDLLPIVQATYTVDGRLRAAPYNVSTPVLLFEAGRMRAAGLDPAAPPRTPDELRDALQRHLEAGAAGSGLALYDAATSWIVEQWAAQEGRLLAEPSNGHEAGRVDRLRFDTPENVRWLTWLQDLHADGLVSWNGLNASSFDNLLDLVSDDPAAMTFHTSASLGDILDLVEAGTWGPLEVGAGPLPGPGSGGLVGGGALWLVDRGVPERVGAAWDVVAWLMGSANLARLAGATGYVPPRRSVLDEPALQSSWAARPQLRVGYDQLADLPDDPARVGLQIGPRAQVQRLLEIAASLMITGEVDPADELRLAEQRAFDLLAEYERG